jgi:hypothetical protein
LKRQLALPISTMSQWWVKCPELNSQENILQFMRDNWLSNQVFLNAEDPVDHRCGAWNRLEARPWRIISIGLRDWAHRF